MTDPRDRVNTDRGLGPVHAEDPVTLPSIASAGPVDPKDPVLPILPDELAARSPDLARIAAEVARTRRVAAAMRAETEANAEEVEPDGASLYYEPKPLVSVSEHKTLEMATVRLSDDIDPRRSPTKISLPRAPRTPPLDSGWPQAEVVLTSSQRPITARRRWRVPALLLTLLGALLSFLVARAIVHRSNSEPAEGRRTLADPLEPQLVSRAPESRQPSPVSATAAASSAATQARGAGPAGVAAHASAVAPSVPVHPGAAPAPSLPADTPPAAATSSAARRVRAPSNAAATTRAPGLSAAPESAAALPASSSPKPKRAIY